MNRKERRRFIFTSVSFENRIELVEKLKFFYSAHTSQLFYIPFSSITQLKWPQTLWNPKWNLSYSYCSIQWGATLKKVGSQLCRSLLHIWTSCFVQFSRVFQVKVHVLLPLTGTTPTAEHNWIVRKVVRITDLTQVISKLFYWYFIIILRLFGS